MKAVVTGAAGFVGSHLVQELKTRGDVVIGVDRRSRPSGDNYLHLLVDLADEPADKRLAAAVAEADVVFHLAARPGVRDSGPQVETARTRDNVVATRNVLALVPRHIPVVVTSSSSAYGNRSDGSASREGDPLRPRGGYARSKVAMERVCRERRLDGGMTAIVRPFTIAGEGQRPDMAFSLWLDALRRGDPISLFGSPARSRDITDVSDVVEGLIRVGERSLNRTVNLGTGVGHRLIDMAYALMDASGLDGQIMHGPVSADEVDATLADTALCGTLLGFVPSTDLRSLLTRQVGASQQLVTVS